ncbi:MAG: DUF2798 domain-containing protein [Cellvibrio sp.]
MPLSFHLRLLAVQFCTAFLLSGAITFINKGLTDQFIADWSKVFLLAFLLVPFVVQLIPHLKQWLAKVLNANKDHFAFKCFAAFCIAVVMETVIAFALTSLQFGWQSGFFTSWVTAAVMALPVGMVIGLTMVFWLEPKIHALIAEGKRLQALKNAG